MTGESAEGDGTPLAVQSVPEPSEAPGPGAEDSPDAEAKVDPHGDARVEVDTEAKVEAEAKADADADAKAAVEAASDSALAPAGRPTRWRHLQPRPARRWPRRLLIGLDIFVGICLLASATAYGYVRWRYGQITSVDLPSLVPVGAAGTVGGPAETILIVGSDTRSQQTPASAKAFGSAAVVGGQRSDTIMLLRVDPKNGATLLSIPRDLWVSIPGTRGKDRINATFNTGPDLLIRAIHDDLHIDINHYIEVDFASFRGIVNAIGGVKVWFPTPARDFLSGLNITTAGCASLNGDVSLAYVRARHYQYFENGYWHIEPDSDLARIRRQQDFVRRVMRKTLNSGVDNPAQLNRVVGAVVNNLTVDRSLKQHPAELARLAKQLRVLGADSLATLTIPTTPVVIGGGDVLLEHQPDADHTIAQFVGQIPPPPTPPPTGPSAPVNARPADVRVRVLNGSGVTGQATATSRALVAAGFGVTYAGAADNYRYTTSVIRYAAADQAKAQLLASYVKGGAQLQPDAAARPGEVVLVTASSFGGITASAGVAGAPTTSTPATTTTTQPPALPGGPADAAPANCRY